VAGASFGRSLVWPEPRVAGASLGFLLPVCAALGRASRCDLWDASLASPSPVLSSRLRSCVLSCLVRSRLTSRPCSRLRHCLAPLSGGLSGPVSHGTLVSCRVWSLPVQYCPVRSGPVSCVVSGRVRPHDSQSSEPSPVCNLSATFSGSLLVSVRVPVMFGPVAPSPVLSGAVLACRSRGSPPAGSSRAVRCVVVYHSYPAEHWYS